MMVFDMKTFSPKKQKRLSTTGTWSTPPQRPEAASEIAIRLRGKHKAIYAPHCDTGDFIVVVNAEKSR